MRVSVHIVTFNSASVIGQCLENVFMSEFPIEEIVVVDNNSSDDTCDLLEREYKNRIRLIKNERNVGFAEAHNQAIRTTTTDYFVVLNPDVELSPDYISKIVSKMSADVVLGMGTGKLIRKSDPRLIDTTGICITRSRRAFDRGSMRPISEYRENKIVFGVSGAAAVYSRRMTKDIEINGDFFDSKFFAYKEDVDVSWRANLLGWKAIYVADATGYHERGWKEGGRRNMPIMIRKYSYINRYRMMLKNETWVSFLCHLPYIVAFEFVMLCFMLLKDREVFPAWRDLLCELDEVISVRKQIRLKRRKTNKEILDFLHLQ